MQRVGVRAAVLAIALLAASCASTATVDSASEAPVSSAESPAVVEETPSSAADEPSAPATPTTEATTTAPAPAASEAPSSSEAPVGELVNLVGGGQLDLNSIEGTDTVLWFWAPW